MSAQSQAVSATAPAGERSSTIRSILGASSGNLVEWYDWYTYAAMSLYFADSFFPGSNRTAQLLNTAAIFGIGFLVRPLGGWLMGSYADRYGRKEALTLSVMIMCAGSLIIALTPKYETIGVAAPVILVIARLLQGLSVGGEYGASATYLSEVASSNRRGFYSSFQYVTLIMGQLLALGTLMLLQFVLLTPEQLNDWGWRIPFVIGAACALVALYIRRNLVETESFTHAKPRAPDVSVLRTLLGYPRQIAIVIGLTMGGTLAFYTFTTYTQKFLVNTSGMSKEQSTLILAAALFVFMCLQPMFGALSDRIGRRPLLIGFGVLGTLLTVPALSTLATTSSPLSAFLLIVGMLTVISGYTSINAVVKAELFPVEIRALGVALPYAIAVSIFGGSAEYVALWLKNLGHEEAFYGYVAACIFVSLLVYLTMPETRKVKL
ncbi:MFS transporter [Peristeroidobacter soli]|jgi:MHS family alpha-ketoglutarate permease-like MFS transporter|uniref:MFS transporter n=1 Tax=Peristeroidobacter soli TaxID=2497877 RepID=UPI00101C2B32|nr:MFS transporter [Peristeroidobacter soli]